MKPVSPLLTDFYQLTMAQAYLASGLADRESVFQLFFRKAPFKSSFAVACGLEDAASFIENFRFSHEDMDYLRAIRTIDQTPQFSESFLSYLKNLRLTVDVDAVDEGCLMFAPEPLLRVRGPLLQCQLLETALLTIINFQTLIATKAARIRYAAQNDEVIEFGLRRAHGVDGGLSASRAAFVGGCNSTSNVLAGREFSIPVKGTMAHSFVMAFSSEEEAFSSYARALPHNCVMLVDTYNTVDGIKSAIAVGKELVKRGQKLLGIRLDSGDLVELSKTARSMLNEAKFFSTQIVASGDLDEYEIARLKNEGAPITVWGVGTRLTTAFEEPALGGIYKLVALRDTHHALIDRMKFSSDEHKATLPGALQTKRVIRHHQWHKDILYPAARNWPDDEHHVDLLKPLIRAGVRVGTRKPLSAIQQQTLTSLSMLDDAHRSLENPKPFVVEIDAEVLAAAAQLRKTYESAHHR